MQTGRPLCLYEATITLALADADDRPAGTLWAGAQPEVFRAAWEGVTVRVAGTGAKFAARHVVDGEHQLVLESVWLLQRDATPDGAVTRYGTILTDYVPNEVDRLVLDVEWVEENTGMRYGRRYTGVKPAAYHTENRDGPYEFAARLAFTAEDCQPLTYLESGILATSDGLVGVTGAQFAAGT